MIGMRDRKSNRPTCSFSVSRSARNGCISDHKVLVFRSKMSKVESKQRRSPATAAEYVDRLQSDGRYSFTSSELEDAIGGSPLSRQAALRRLRQKVRVVSPRRGFNVIVPLEYRSSGSPPASWFIADLMSFLKQPYYVGLLTAAAIHGASHQQPQTFQVMTSIPTRPVAAGRQWLDFHRNRHLQDVPVQMVRTETGSMVVSTPEATALDLLRFPDASGQLDHVTTVLQELAERMDPDRLVEAARNSRTPDVQRLGYLLEFLGLPTLFEPLADVVDARNPREILLRPNVELGDAIPHARWSVTPNVELAADL
ncbi:hypothetical protein DYH09_21645 [bacterium CPR1]|nr:hypothetical protein [bacterium CPR1]